jgi:hypothetical protein
VDGAGGVVEGDEVGEGAADVERERERHGYLPPSAAGAWSLISMPEL